MAVTPAVRFIARGFLCLSVVLFFGFPLKTQETGEALFEAKCAMCHGPDAAGKTPMGQTLKVPNLHSEQVQKMTDTELLGVVAKGKNKMPGYEGKLPKGQIEQLVLYIRTLVKH